MNSLGLALIALCIIGYGLLSRRFEQGIVTPPMAFVVVGVVFGPLVLDVFHVELESEFIRILAEVTLVIILFCDAARIHFGTLRSNVQIPARMLGIGMPLTLLLGTGIAWLAFGELMLWEAALLAAILMPTDAALGQAIVSNKRVPVRMRQAITVESGLNDGLALPVVLFLIDMSILEPSMHTAGFWLGFVLQQIFLGIAIGAVVAYAGGYLMERAITSGSSNHVFQDISSVALALCCFAVAELAGGNGFIAAFVGGLTLGNTTERVRTHLYDFAEAEGQLLTLIMFLVFGSGMVIFAIQQPDLNWPVVILFSVLSLTLVRMIPVGISLLGMKLQPTSQLYLGWFGPRGIASILFALIVLERTAIPHHEEIFSVVIITVLISVFAHGLTSWPLSKLYAERLASAESPDDMPEHADVTEIRSRYPLID